MALPEGVWPESDPGPKLNGGKQLVAESSADRYTLAANGATTAQHRGASLGLHARAKSVRLHAMAAVGLKCALGHRIALLLPIGNLCLDGKL